jgi:hypothetical protein
MLLKNIQIVAYITIGLVALMVLVQILPNLLTLTGAGTFMLLAIDILVLWHFGRKILLGKRSELTDFIQ